MKLIILIACTCLSASAFCQNNYYNTQQYENNRKAEAQRNLDAQNDRNRAPNATNKTNNSGGRAATPDAPANASPTTPLTAEQRAFQNKLQQQQGEDWAAYKAMNPDYSIKKDIADKPEDYVEIQYTDRSHYAGGYKNKKFNGYGTLYTTQGGTYEGNWVDNEREGEGKQISTLGMDIYGHV